MHALFAVAVVVLSARADHTDAARLQQLVENSVRSTAPVVISIDYYGAANAKMLPPPSTRRGDKNQFVFAVFTISDPSGKVLDSGSVRYDPMLDRLPQLHKAADVIGKRFVAPR